MISLSNYTFSTLLSEMLARVSSDLNKREGSLIRTSLSAAAWVMEGIYIELAFIQNQAFALFATGDYLDYKVAERGLIRKDATASIRQGTFNISPPVGARFAAKNVTPQIVYYVSSTPVLSSGVYTAELTCETAGVVGDSYSGDLLAVTFIAGLVSATLGSIIIGGSNVETDEALRLRYKESMAEISFGGNIAAYRNYILSLDNVGAVQVYPTWNGGGTVLCSILDTDLDIASAGLISVVQAAVCPPEASNSTPSANGYGMAPIGAVVTITTGTTVSIDISAALTLSSGYTITSVTPYIREKLELYVTDILGAWGSPVNVNTIQYNCVFYVSQVIARILSVDGVVNVTSVEINNSASDLTLTETASLQQVPSLGTLSFV